MFKGPCTLILYTKWFSWLPMFIRKLHGRQNLQLQKFALHAGKKTVMASGREKDQFLLFCEKRIFINITIYISQPLQVFQYCCFCKFSYCTSQVVALLWCTRQQSELLSWFCYPMPLRAISSRCNVIGRVVPIDWQSVVSLDVAILFCFSVQPYTFNKVILKDFQGI